MKSVMGHTIRWCSKHSEHIYVTYEKNQNPNAPKKICAVAVWLTPGTVPVIPLDTLVMEFGKAVAQIGGKRANRLRQVMKGIESFIHKTCAQQQHWELFYLAVKNEIRDKRELWEEILWRVFIQADKSEQAVWSFVSDPDRVKFLEPWGFTVDQTGELDGKVSVYGLFRNPPRQSRVEVDVTAGNPGSPEDLQHDDSYT